MDGRPSCTSPYRTCVVAARLQITSGAGANEAPTWSPDGAELAFIVKHQGLGERPQHSPGDVYIARLGAEGFTNLTDGSVHDVWSASWSPRGDSLLLFSLFGQTWYEPPSTSIRVIDRLSGDVHQIAGIEELGRIASGE